MVFQASKQDISASSELLSLLRSVALPICFLPESLWQSLIYFINNIFQRRINLILSSIKEKAFIYYIFINLAVFFSAFKIIAILLNLKQEPTI